MADSTGEGSSTPSWQADPVAAAIPGVAASTSAPRVLLMEMLRVPGSRCSGWPLRLTRSGSRSASRWWRVSRSSVSWLALWGRDVGRDATGGAQGHDQRDVLGPGVPAVFLAPAVDRGLEPCAGSDVEGANTLGGVHLVPDHGEEVDAELGHVDRDLARGLGGVSVEQRTVGVGDAGQLRDGLQGAGLGVGQHDADQGGVAGDGLLKVGWVDPAVVVHREDGEPEAVGFEAAAGLEHGGMFGGLGDDVVASVAVGPGRATDRQRVGVGSTRGEHDLVDVSAEQVCDLAAGMPNRLPGGLAVVVGARWVAEVHGQVGQRGFDDPWVDRGGGVVVEVDGAVAEPGVPRCGLGSHVRRRRAGRHGGRCPVSLIERSTQCADLVARREMLLTPYLALAWRAWSERNA